MVTFHHVGFLRTYLTLLHQSSNRKSARADPDESNHRHGLDKSWSHLACMLSWVHVNEISSQSGLAILPRSRVDPRTLERKGQKESPVEGINIQKNISCGSFYAKLNEYLGYSQVNLNCKQYQTSQLFTVCTMQHYRDLDCNRRSISNNSMLIPR